MKDQLVCAFLPDHINRRLKKEHIFFNFLDYIFIVTNDHFVYIHSENRFEFSKFYKFGDIDNRLMLGIIAVFFFKI